MLSDLPKVTQPVCSRAGTGSQVPVTPKPGVPPTPFQGGEAHSANLTILFRSPLFSTAITHQGTKGTTEVQGCGSDFSPVIEWSPPHHTVLLCTYVPAEQKRHEPLRALACVEGLHAWQSLTHLSRIHSGQYDTTVNIY